MKDKHKHIVPTKEEQHAFLASLKGKGIQKPKNWKLVHTAICNDNELSFDIIGLQKKLAQKLNFAVSVQAAPDKKSSSDTPLFKVRYKYVLHPRFSAEPLIKGNSREFCKALISANTLFRIEDINMMSFRGTNPIAKQNYSIFRLRGHWNCRHAWQREIFLVSQDKPKNEGQIILSEIEEKLNKNKMSKPTKTLAQLALSLFKGNKEKLSLSEAAELSKAIAEAADLKHVDVMAKDGTIRAEGEEIKVGAAVAWVDAEGVLGDIPDGTYKLEAEKMTIEIADGKITEVTPDEDEDDAAAAAKKAEDEAAGAFNAETSHKELSKKLDDFMAKFSTEDITKAISKDLKTELTAHVDAEIKKIPAVKVVNGKQEFSADESKNPYGNKKYVTQ